jgi:hypothetical protein
VLAQRRSTQQVTAERERSDNTYASTQRGPGQFVLPVPEKRRSLLQVSSLLFLSSTRDHGALVAAAVERNEELKEHRASEGNTNPGSTRCTLFFSKPRLALLQHLPVSAMRSDVNLSSAARQPLFDLLRDASFSDWSNIAVLCDTGVSSTVFCVLFAFLYSVQYATYHCHVAHCLVAHTWRSYSQISCIGY